ncbi:hypothetical protein HK100_010782, partial [Physocladia obscura]
YWYINPETNGRTSVVISVDYDAGAINATVNALQYNAFCAGHSQGADGQIWVVGGDWQSSSTLTDWSQQTPVNGTDAGTFLYPGIDHIRSFTPGEAAAGT